jgi:hypothetical protein
MEDCLFSNWGSVVVLGNQSPRLLAELVTDTDSLLLLPEDVELPVVLENCDLFSHALPVAHWVQLVLNQMVLKAEDLDLQTSRYAIQGSAV